MADFDTPWKEGLCQYFEQFMALAFPEAHADIDWSGGYEVLDKELQQVVRESEEGRRVVDMLVRVWRKNGDEEWVFIHVEVQTWPTVDFERRMFVCNYRIFDRFGRMVMSLGVLADERPAWRPGRFGYNLWGCSIDFRFPTVKLLDLPEQELEQSQNIFATVVLAHRAAQRTAGQNESRRTQKIRLIRRLYERGLAQDQVRQLFRLIDWFLDLPQELEDEVWREVEQIEQEKHMPYVTSVERIGIQKGLQQAVELTLVARFGEEGKSLMNAIRPGANAKFFQSLLQRLPSLVTADDVRHEIEQSS